MRTFSLRPALLNGIALALASISVACVGIPFYVIRPFRHQGAQELAGALFVKQAGPAVSIVCAVLAIAAVWCVWATSSKWLARTTTVVLAALAVGGAWYARLNMYESMFHPIGSPAFTSADRVRIESDDMVMAVHAQDDYRAYPIREMAYHHVVNDSLAGEPIVATY